MSCIDETCGKHWCNSCTSARLEEMTEARYRAEAERDVAVRERDEYKQHVRDAYDARDAAIARAEQAEAERDKWQAFEAANVKEYGLIEASVAERIAAWLDRRAIRLEGYTEQQAETETIVEELRAGSWREKAGE